jgi:hypothetical protein
MNAILERIDAGTLIRGAWSGHTADGREGACLYTALVPGATSTANCPPHLMPQWVADLTPWINDAGTPATWLGFARRYGLARAKWSALTYKKWAKVYRSFRAELIRSILAGAARIVPADAPYWPAVVKASEDIQATLRAGREPTKAQRLAAKAAEKAAAEAVGWGAREAERAAEAAWRATELVCVAGAVWAVWQSAACKGVKEARAEADHLIDYFLTLVEMEIAGG